MGKDPWHQFFFSLVRTTNPNTISQVDLKETILPPGPGPLYRAFMKDATAKATSWQFCSVKTGNNSSCHYRQKTRNGTHNRENHIIVHHREMYDELMEFRDTHSEIRGKSAFHSHSLKRLSISL